MTQGDFGYTYYIIIRGKRSISYKILFFWSFFFDSKSHTGSVFLLIPKLNKDDNRTEGKKYPNLKA